MPQSSVIAALQRELVSPKVQEGKEHLLSSSQQITAISYGEPWRKEVQDVKTQGTGPR